MTTWAALVWIGLSIGLACFAHITRPEPKSSYRIVTNGESFKVQRGHRRTIADDTWQDVVFTGNIRYFSTRDLAQEYLDRLLARDRRERGDWREVE